MSFVQPLGTLHLHSDTIIKGKKRRGARGHLQTHLHNMYATFLLFLFVFSSPFLLIQPTVLTQQRRLLEGPFVGDGPGGDGESASYGSTTDAAHRGREMNTM